MWIKKDEWDSDIEIELSYHTKDELKDSIYKTLNKIYNLPEVLEYKTEVIELHFVFSDQKFYVDQDYSDIYYGNPLGSMYVNINEFKNCHVNIYWEKNSANNYMNENKGKQFISETKK